MSNYLLEISDGIRFLIYFSALSILIYHFFIIRYYKRFVTSIILFITSVMCQIIYLIIVNITKENYILMEIRLLYAWGFLVKNCITLAFIYLIYNIISLTGPEEI